MKQSLVTNLVLSVSLGCCSILMPGAHAHLIRKHRKTLVTGSDVFVKSRIGELNPTEGLSKSSKKHKDLKCTVKHKKQKKTSSSSKGSKGSTPTVSPAPTLVTMAPTKSSKGHIPSELCPTIISACALLERQEAEFETLDYRLDMTLAVDTEVTSDVLRVLQDYLAEALNQALSACLEFDVRRRRLQDSSTNIMKLDLMVSEDTTTPCPATPPSEGRCLNVDVDMFVTHDDGDAETIRLALLQALLDRCDEIESLPGISDALDPCESLSVITIPCQDCAPDGIPPTDGQSGGNEGNQTDTNAENPTAGGSEEEGGTGNDPSSNSTNTNTGGNSTGDDSSTGSQGQEGSGATDNNSTDYDSDGQGGEAIDDGTSGGSSNNTAVGEGSSGGSGGNGNATDGEGSTGGNGGNATDEEGSTGGSGGIGNATDGEGSTGGSDGDGNVTVGEGSGGTSNGHEYNQTTPGDSNSTNDGGVAAVVSTQTSEDRVEPRGYILSAVAAIILLFLIFFAARRRRTYNSALRHKQLEDDGDYEDETYIKESDVDTQDLRERQAHVVGEADSVFSGWSGFSGERERDNPSPFIETLNQDVHRCASATCELCERKRRAGVQFIPAKMPSHSSSIPSNPPRHYLTEDTVAL